MIYENNMWIAPFEFDIIIYINSVLQRMGYTLHPVKEAVSVLSVFCVALIQDSIVLFSSQVRRGFCTEKWFIFDKFCFLIPLYQSSLLTIFVVAIIAGISWTPGYRFSKLLCLVPISLMNSILFARDKTYSIHEWRRNMSWSLITYDFLQEVLRRARVGTVTHSRCNAQLCGGLPYHRDKSDPQTSSFSCFTYSLANL